MVVTSPEKVPQKKITSVDVTGFSGGLNLLAEQGVKANQIVDGRNVVVTPDGFLTTRDSAQPWLPDTVQTAYMVYPVHYKDKLVYFTADDGKMKWCSDGDQKWTDCGGENVVTTGNGVKTRMLRVLDCVLVFNGVDKLSYVDLKNKEVVKYHPVGDPTVAPTATNTQLSGDTFKIYYGYTFSSVTGETKISPILTHSVKSPRDNWDGTKEFVTVKRPDGNPANATSWNLYIALAANGGTIQETDMLMLASGLDLNTTSVVDNGTLAIDIGKGTPPSDNSTDGARVTYGIETSGRPILFGDVDNPYNIWIGGDGDHALNFSASHGGYRAEVSKGTNYYPTSVIGFRNGQGIPSLTILFSNTEGLSKQATLEQQTVNYGNQSFVVWSVTEQNYGAAGVAAADGAVNYKGSLMFPSTDGFMSMDTQPQMQNVLATRRMSDEISSYVKSIIVEALPNVVGTAWDNKVYWTIPSYGNLTPNNILVRDLSNNGAWYTLNIKAQWVGVVSPPDGAAFVYFCQGNKICKLFEHFGTVDYISGSPKPFSTFAKGALMGINEAHNSYQAVVQAVFYLVNLVGTITVGVNYRNENGKIKTKRKVFKASTYKMSYAGGWSDPHYVYAHLPTPATWDTVAKLDPSAASVKRITKRIPLQMNVLASEVQWFIETPADYCDYLLRAVSFEGENLGIKPDLR